MDINKFSPTYKLEKKDVLSISDIEGSDIFEILYSARILKKKSHVSDDPQVLKGKTVVIISKSNATRMRIAFEIGVRQLGGDCIFLPADSISFNSEGGIQDTALTLSRYRISALILRGFDYDEVREFAKYATFPVLNDVNDAAYPVQILTDLFTIWEKKGVLNGLKVAYIGSGKNITNSLIMASVKCGIDLYVSCPEGYDSPDWVVKKAKQYGDFTVCKDVKDAVRGADVVYTSAVSYKEEISDAAMKEIMTHQVNKELMKLAKPDALFMHSLPIVRGIEVTQDVLDMPNSIVYDQAENKMHVHKALLCILTQNN